MSKTIGILQGKQEKHNKAILRALFDNGPLTVWEIAGKLTNTGKVSLHATLNKSIRLLEKKGYVAKLPNSPKWILNFKGIMTVLILQETYKPLGKEWANLVEKMKLTKDQASDYNSEINWSKMASIAKRLLEEGVINWDVIKNQTLAVLLVSEQTDSIFDMLDGDDEIRKEITKKYLERNREVLKE